MPPSALVILVLTCLVSLTGLFVAPQLIVGGQDYAMSAVQGVNSSTSTALSSTLSSINSALSTLNSLI